MTASRLGTSTPSDKQRALVKMLQTLPSFGVFFSQRKFLSRSELFWVPSTCSDSTARSLLTLAISLKVLEIILESVIPEQKATAVCMGAGSASASSSEMSIIFFASALIQPLILAASLACFLSEDSPLTVRTITL